MRDPSTWLGLWPESTRDRLALSCVLFGVPVAVFFEFLLIVPHYIRIGSTEYMCHLLLCVFLVHNFVGNLFKIVTTDPSGRSSDLPSVLRPGWRYCYQCKLNAPPRAYHCPACDLCILKRDHHCSFAGTCIGYQNHRYYLMAVLYGWIGCAYALWWHWSYIWEGLGGISWWAIFCIVMPHMALISMQIGPFQFLLGGVQMSTMTGLALCSYLMIAQVFCICRGQTLIERRDMIRYYDLGPKLNMLDVLGHRWYATWVSPFLPSILPGNGLKFHVRTEEEEHVKDL